MACHVHDNQPLCRALRDAGLEEQLKSCGIRKSPDALIGGYCQALFPLQGRPGEHTRHVADALEKAGALYNTSHELFWGYRPHDMTTTQWLTEATEMFRQGDGCVPVLITGLNVAAPEVSEIFAAPRQLGEPILVRVLVNEGSIRAAADLVRRLFDEMRLSAEIPAWWPLFQSTFGLAGWELFERELGEYWKYASIAMNPFTPKDVQDFVCEQIVVVQVPVGLADGIGNDIIKLPLGMKVNGASDGDEYSLGEYLERVEELTCPKIFILLGPATANSSESMNIDRMRRMLEVLAQHSIVL